MIFTYQFDVSDFIAFKCQQVFCFQIPFALNQSCEELPLDFSSVKDYCDKLLNDFSDVNNGERKIMNMWNNYIMHIMGRSFVHLPKLLEDFIRDKGHDIVDQHLFR